MFVPRSLRAPASTPSKPLRSQPATCGKSPTVPLSSLQPSPSSAVAASSKLKSDLGTVAGFSIPPVVSSGHSCSSSASLSAAAIDHVSSISHPADLQSAPVLHLQHGTICTTAATPGSAPTENVKVENSQDDPIVQKSIDQRAAEADEPTCVVCGRYGEYICDETDDDVCSLECKAIVLRGRTNRNEAKAASPDAVPDSIPSSKQGAIFDLLARLRCSPKLICHSWRMTSSSSKTVNSHFQIGSLMVS
ncbi:hypothetical protein Mapa_017210 [Marchantia paleacea]|nr:hypothetical protein Mapa_017210 [Marchantia paleacea]